MKYRYKYTTLVGLQMKEESWNDTKQVNELTTFLKVSIVTWTNVIFVFWSVFVYNMSFLCVKKKKQLHIRHNFRTIREWGLDIWHAYSFQRHRSE